MFLSLLKFETKKIMRNKLLLVFLLIFPLAMTLFINSIEIDFKKPVSSGTGSGGESSQTIENTNSQNYTAFYSNGTEEDEQKIDELISAFYNLNTVFRVDTFATGERMLKLGEIYLFVKIDTTTEPISAVFYYDDTSMAGGVLVRSLRKKQLENTYDSLIEFLSSYGITINEDYFNFITFEPIQGFDISYKQQIMSMASSFVAIVVMFGLAYSMARDNETNVIKQISYTPISVHKYLFSKSIPFLILGFLQASMLLLLGQVLYGIIYQVNIFVILLVYLLFILSSISLGLIFSSFNNQTTSTFATVTSILLPLLAMSISFLKSYPDIVEYFLYLSPLTSFYQLLTQMTFNGIYNSSLIILLCAQCVVYYVIAFVLLKLKASKR